MQALAVGGPILLGTLTARVISQLFDPHTSIWLVGTVSLGTAIAVSVVVARLAAKLLPLALLLRMTMLFPDRAPNRFKVARRATSKDELAERLAHPDSDVREAATTLLALVTALGRHDRKTRGHSERVRLYCDLIGNELGLNEAERGRLRWVGLLHDIGKLEVAAAVLNKPGKLTGNEWETVRTHPDTGAKLAGPLADWLGPWFAGIREHHEHFDGSGYPRGLAGEHISLAGRAVSVVDAFETMTAARSYKSPMTTVAARAELARCAGTHFDPNVVRAFLTIALPRLLWTMGPLTFLVNFPFLRWIPSASVRAADVAAAGVNTAAGAVGVTAVTVAAATAHTPIIHTHGPVPARPAMAAATARQLSQTPLGTTLPGTALSGQATTQNNQGPSTVRLPTEPDTTIDAAGSGAAGTVAAGQAGIHPHAAVQAAGQPAGGTGTDSGGSSGGSVTQQGDGSSGSSDNGSSGSSGSGSSGSGSSGSGSSGSGSAGSGTSGSSGSASTDGGSSGSGSSGSGSTGSGTSGSGSTGSGTSGSGSTGSGTSGSGSTGSGTSGSGSTGSGTSGSGSTGSGTSGSGSTGSGTSGSGSSGSGTSGSGSSGSGTSGSGSSGSGTSGSGSSGSGTSGGGHRRSGGLLGGLLGLLSEKHP